MEIGEQKHRTIDLDYLKATCANDETLMNMVMKTFVDKTPALIDSLGDANRSQRWEEVKSISHKLKSSFLTFGAKDTSEVLAEVESSSTELLASNENQSDHINQLVAQASELGKKVIEEINEELGKN